MRVGQKRRAAAHAEAERRNARGIDAGGGVAHEPVVRGANVGGESFR